MKVETKAAKEDNRIATEELQTSKTESALRAELDDRVAENASLKTELAKLKESLQETRTCLEKQSEESVRKEASGKMVEELQRQVRLVQTPAIMVKSILYGIGKRTAQ